jgi:transcription-repair coupling factor (superfamily II helicase)
LTETARRRLEAIREFSDLGAGFRVAARDLEIRGAGNLLGAEQSGHIAAVGIEMYLRMLDETVRELRGETVAETPSVTIDLPIALAIPEDYIADASLRMDIYRKIAAGDVSRDAIVIELEDRFGKLPDALHQLLGVASLKRLAESLRVQSISARGGELQMRMRRDTRIDVDRLIRIVSERPEVGFSPSGVLKLAQVDPTEMVERASRLLREIGPDGGVN